MGLWLMNPTTLNPAKGKSRFNLKEPSCSFAKLNYLHYQSNNNPGLVFGNSTKHHHGDLGESIDYQPFI
jgi:hypothetical protein